MRVLLLNLYYPPDTSATAKMAQTVVKALAFEHDVTVLCGRPSYDPTERRPWRFYQSEKDGRTTIIRVGSTDYPRREMRKRVLNYLSYVLLSVPRALFLPCDVVLAMTDPPFEGIVGALVALLKGKPFVYNIRDMYPDMAVGGAIVGPGFLSRVWEKLHRWALKRAARVIALGGDMRDRIIAKGVSPGNISIVRDGTEIPDATLQPAPLDHEVIALIRKDFRFVLLHAGNLGFYGAWETLIQGAAQLSDEGIGLVLVGDGAQRDHLKHAAKDIPSIRFLPFFPGSKIPSVLAAADAHVITVKRGLEGVVVPSKMYGILAAGKPILAVAPEACDVVSIGKTMGFSLSVDPDNAAEFAETVRRIAADPDLVCSMGRAAFTAAPQFEQKRELSKLTRILREVQTRHRHR